MGQTGRGCVLRPALPSLDKYQVSNGAAKFRSLFVFAPPQGSRLPYRRCGIAGAGQDPSLADWPRGGCVPLSGPPISANSMCTPSAFAAGAGVVAVLGPRRTLLTRHCSERRYWPLHGESNRAPRWPQRYLGTVNSLVALCAPAV